jgi:uncharacterized membrane protein YciS (DUF1049 family)
MKFLLSSILIVSLFVIALSYLAIIGGFITIIDAIYNQPQRYLSTLLNATYAVIAISISTYLLHKLVNLINKRLESSK